jgi:methylmalonyl-CoA/ethylmalonyl-CoA epimerase
MIDSKSSSAIAQFGTPMQIAFVPENFDDALQGWAALGVGPFFVRAVPVDEVRYRGQPADIQFEVAIGYWGEMQIELIRQTNDAASIYNAGPKGAGDAVHHIGILVDDIDRALERCVAAGLEVLQEVTTGTTRAVYVDLCMGTDILLELIQLGESGRAGFAMMREAARNWDGSDPVRAR